MAGREFRSIRWLAGPLVVLVLIAGGVLAIKPALFAAQQPNISGSALRYSTYLGGRGSDFGQAIGADARGNVYVAGMSNSSRLGPGASSALPGNDDRAFVVKLASGGHRELYTVWLPASTVAMTVDRAGDVYLTGSTHDPHFPVRHALRSRITGRCWGSQYCDDAFVTKLDPNGHVVYSTLLGGSCEDWGTAIAVDAGGDAYVTGATESSDFPTAHALQPHYAGPYPHGGAHGCLAAGMPPQPWGDAFVAKLSPGGSRLIYSTFLGGPGNDGAGAIAVDPHGDAYVAGTPGTPGFPMRRRLPVPMSVTVSEIFVAKLDPGGRLLFSTYLGGSRRNTLGAIAVGSAGNIYITGATDSPDFPTRHAFDRHYAGGMCPDYTDGIFYCLDAFVTKLSADGRHVLYSTYVGSSRDDVGNDIAVDAAGDATIVGSTQSANFPLRRAAQRSFRGGQCGHTICTDAFASTLDTRGCLIFSTFLGGGGDDGGDLATAVTVVDRSIWVTGTANSATFPTVAPLQSYNGAPPDAFVAELHPAGR